MYENNMRQLYMTEKIKNFAYNVKYKAVAYIEECNKQSIINPYAQIHLLGKKYNSNPSNIEFMNKQIYRQFLNIIWITYRSGFPQLLSGTGIQESYVTDTGWGCMIRVGQMLFAEILKNYLSPKSKEQFLKICNQFNDFTQSSIFSIQKIAILGRKDFDLKPGEWYNPSQIAYILSNILNKCQKKQYKNLKSIIFNNANLFFDQIISVMIPNYIKCKHNLDKNLVCTTCNKTSIELAIIILVRIGLSKPEEKYLQILNKMMQFSYFRGLIGGKPQKALYFVGKRNQEYVYLDPHYVQTAKIKMEQINNSYFCESFRLCKNTLIDPSLGICFYIKNLDQLNQFHKNMMKLKQDSEMFISIENETPQYLIKMNQQEEREIEEQDDTFQVI